MGSNTFTTNASSAFADTVEEHFKPALSESDYRRARRLTATFCRFHKLLKFEKVTVANTAKAIENTQRLLYREYLRRDLCEKNKDQKYFSAHLLMPSTVTLASYRFNKMIGTVSIIQDGLMRLPSDTLYSDELNKFRGEGRRLVEIGALALDHRYFNKAYSLKSAIKMNSLFTLFAGMLNYVYQFTEATDLVIMVNPKHRFLYEYLGFQIYAETKQYEHVGKEAVPMILDIERFISNCDKFAPVYLLISSFKKLQLPTPYQYTANDIVSRFIECPEHFESMNTYQKKALFIVYPELQKRLVSQEQLLTRTIAEYSTLVEQLKALAKLG